MTTVEIVRMNGSQSVTLPPECHFEVDAVSIRREGDEVILAPVKPTSCPPGFFEKIRIDDPAFVRPPQGEVQHASLFN